MKTDKEIVEDIYHRFDRIGSISIKDAITEGIKAGRKQLAEEILKFINEQINKCNQEQAEDDGEVSQHILLGRIRELAQIKEKLKKEAEK